MATSGTYVTEVPLKGTAEKHYKRWKSENHVFPDAIGHHIQNVTVHEGEHDSHGSIRSWNYTWGIHLLYFFSFFSSQHISFIVREALVTVCYNIQALIADFAKKSA